MSYTVHIYIVLNTTCNSFRSIEIHRYHNQGTHTPLHHSHGTYMMPSSDALSFCLAQTFTGTFIYSLGIEVSMKSAEDAAQPEPVPARWLNPADVELSSAPKAAAPTATELVDRCSAAAPCPSAAAPSAAVPGVALNPSTISHTRTGQRKTMNAR
jgi:hypothetical protein